MGGVTPKACQAATVCLCHMVPLFSGENHVAAFSSVKPGCISALFPLNEFVQSAAGGLFDSCRDGTLVLFGARWEATQQAGNITIPTGLSVSSGILQSVSTEFGLIYMWSWTEPIGTSVCICFNDEIKHLNHCEPSRLQSYACDWKVDFHLSVLGKVDFIFSLFLLAGKRKKNEAVSARMCEQFNWNFSLSL